MKMACYVYQTFKCSFFACSGRLTSKLLTTSCFLGPAKKVIGKMGIKIASVIGSGLGFCNACNRD